MIGIFHEITNVTIQFTKVDKLNQNSYCFTTNFIFSIVINYCLIRFNIKEVYIKFLSMLSEINSLN